MKLRPGENQRKSKGILKTLGMRSEQDGAAIGSQPFRARAKSNVIGDWFPSLPFVVRVQHEVADVAMLKC